MKYFVIFLIFIGCRKGNDRKDDIVNIIFISDGIKCDIFNNKYILDERYKNEGEYHLYIYKNDIEDIKKEIIKEKIYEFEDNVNLTKYCKKICNVDIYIYYKSGRIQHFTFDNHNYAIKNYNYIYKKMIKLEKLILSKTENIIGLPQYKNENID